MLAGSDPHLNYVSKSELHNQCREAIAWLSVRCVTGKQNSYRGWSTDPACPKAHPKHTSVSVLPGAVGPYAGQFPSVLVKPDRNNIAPRIGITWKAKPKTVVRAGYGINYNGGAYQSIVQQLALQPPFSTTQANIPA